MCVRALVSGVCRACKKCGIADSFRGNRNSMLIDWNLFEEIHVFMRKLNHPTSKPKFLCEFSEIHLKSCGTFWFFFQASAEINENSMKNSENRRKLLFQWRAPRLAASLTFVKEVGRFWEAKHWNSSSRCTQTSSPQKFFLLFSHGRRHSLVGAFTHFSFLSNRGHFCLASNGSEKRRRRRTGKNLPLTRPWGRKKRKNFAPLPSFVPFGAAAWYFVRNLL